MTSSTDLVADFLKKTENENHKTQNHVWTFAPMPAIPPPTTRPPRDLFGELVGLTYQLFEFGNMIVGNTAGKVLEKLEPEISTTATNISLIAHDKELGKLLLEHGLHVLQIVTCQKKSMLASKPITYDTVCKFWEKDSITQSVADQYMRDHPSETDKEFVTSVSALSKINIELANHIKEKFQIPKETVLKTTSAMSFYWLRAFSLLFEAQLEENKASFRRSTLNMARTDKEKTSMQRDLTMHEAKVVEYEAAARAMRTHVVNEIHDLGHLIVEGVK